MPRKVTGKHTSPATAGEQNMDADVVEKFRCDAITSDIMRKTAILKEHRQEYSGKWTDEEFRTSVDKFFQFCMEHELEPSKPLIQIWLNVSDRQFYRWLTDPQYGVKSQIVESAIREMEALYFAKLDSRPVPQMFKLKTKHNYVENQKIEVVAEAKVSADEIRDKISQMVTERK